jgi:hypothetical protein
VKPAPAIDPEPFIEEVLPPVKETPVAPPAPKTPVIEKAPVAPAVEPVVSPEPAPEVEEPTQPKEDLSALFESLEESSATIEADPFAVEEIPAAEIVVPPEPKKPWWKLF